MTRTLSSCLAPLTWAALLVLLGIVGAGTAAFLRTPIARLPPESVRSATPPSWALPPGRVVLLVPSFGEVPSSWPYARPIPEWRLRDVGFVVVHTPVALQRAVEDGAVVIWIHRGAVGMIDRGWLRARYHDGHAVGVIGGTMTDLWTWFGIGDRGGSWLRPGGPIPTFALADERQCQDMAGRLQGRGGVSDHFSLGLVASVSASAASLCT